MNENPNYTKYHPQWYRKPIPLLWWTHKKPYTKFFIRELTSIFVALYSLVLLFQARAVAQGPEAYENFLASLQNPISILFHFIALLAILFHCFTWFNLMQKALVLRIGKNPVPGATITAVNFIAWGVLSVIVALIVLMTT